MTQVCCRRICLDLQKSQKIIYNLLSRKFHFSKRAAREYIDQYNSDPAIHQSPRLFHSSNQYRSDIRRVDHASLFYDTSIREYAQQRCTPLSIESLAEYWSAERPMLQKQIESSNLLLSELPIRLAHRIEDLQQLPFMVASNKYLQTIYTMYLHSFDVLKRYPKIRTCEDVITFGEQLKKLFAAHKDVVPNLAHALRDCQKYCPSQAKELHSLLDRMLVRRVSSRMLCGQHLACMNQYPAAEDSGYIDQSLTDTRWLGLIDRECPLGDVAMEVGKAVQERWDNNYGMYPDIHTEGHTNIIFPYMRGHLEYILGEILKNAMRAIVEFNLKVMEKKRIAGHKEYNTLPPVVITMSESPDEVCIKISDQGGGIRHDMLPKIWDYGYSTAEFPNYFWDQSKRKRPSPMHGYGIGLPFARIYARYFGGDLQVNSMDGYGTDVYLKLRQLKERKKKLLIPNGLKKKNSYIKHI